MGVACYVGRYLGVVLEKEKIENNWWPGGLRPFQSRVIKLKVQ